MRIAKFLALTGISSRRKCEELITEGRVAVNGETIFDLGRQVTETDKVTVDGSEVNPEKLVYYMLNKPLGFTTTLADPHAEKLISELFPGGERVWPVGRLDRETKGLLLLTNDGDFTQKVSHPSYSKQKEYLAVLDRPLKDGEAEEIRKGITLPDGPVQADSLEKIDSGIYKIVIHEGRNRIVRRIFDHFGRKVIGLVRTRIGSLEIGNLPEGKYRVLTEKEIKDLINE